MPCLKLNLPFEYKQLAAEVAVQARRRTNHRPKPFSDIQPVHNSRILHHAEKVYAAGIFLHFLLPTGSPIRKAGETPTHSTTRPILRRAFETGPEPFGNLAADFAAANASQVVPQFSVCSSAKSGGGSQKAVKVVD